MHYPPLGERETSLGGSISFHPLLRCNSRSPLQIGKVAGDKRPLTFDVKGLEEGMEYEFRVTAISDEGESEPLYTDCAIKAKNPFGKHATHEMFV